MVFKRATLLHRFEDLLEALLGENHVPAPAGALEKDPALNNVAKTLIIIRKL
jgi:hypothetical protein